MPGVAQALEFRDYSEKGLQAQGMRERLVTDIVLLVFVLLYCMQTTKDVVYSVAVRYTRMRMRACDIYVRPSMSTRPSRVGGGWGICTQGRV